MRIRVRILVKRRMLQPEQIIVPNEYELGNEAILKIYFRIFEKGHGSDLPPVIVTRFKEADAWVRRIEDGKNGLCAQELEPRGLLDEYEREETRRTVEARRQDYRTLFSLLEQSPYFLADGNHKTAAATLARRHIPALELETDQDLERIREMVEQGELFDFPREEETLEELTRSFLSQCLDFELRPDGVYSIPLATTSSLTYTQSVRERVDALVRNEDLPQYMREHYLKGK